ncbi:hypothetical protein [Antribacter gilvus]|uniref:hypothetical protein n=1 Tax=Antribacter gilvus TaxID=2304675 RepID=UPI000F7881F4|nr:hypothetical protein [Antribacter gilvus]
MSEMWGADVAALRAFAQACEKNAQRIDDAARTVDQLIRSSVWKGPNAEEFASRWSSVHRPAAQAAATAVGAMGTKLARNADLQDETSAADDGGRRDQGRDAGGDRGDSRGTDRDDATGRSGDDREGDRDREENRDQQEDDRREGYLDAGPTPADPEHSIPGPQPYPGGLGDPVPGEGAPDTEPPAWSPPDGGSGEHGSEDDGFWDRRKEDAIELAANAAGVGWSDASRNLLHFLDNSGQDLTQPVDTMLKDLPGFEDKVTAREEQLGADAIRRAQASGATGPVTFPVNTAWDGYYAGQSQSANWYYATGGFSYNLNGQVTVYPPDTPGGEWRYETETAVNSRDRYNWDGGKGVNIGPLSVSDAELQELHRKGLAQEYNLVGRSSTRTSEGTG